MQLGGNGFFVPEGTAGTTPGTINLSIGILIAHGWLYVLYLFADFRLWSIMRWKPLRFLLIALGWGLALPLLCALAARLLPRAEVPR